ncbi:NUDIX domain-containing protein [Gordonia sp. HNM0687]|uniref:NUDIX domain-containing protein n=1 Tax=Gordonia mangrovi TaxID=2665643 RepID=A0A6L7GLW6_9ACTN|nr:NUDIX domain-containing protein [Gordonia mangrovi]MXP20880.1 NUDIX domain-containing protein [Gordonia mangrovi]UVF78568.1 NUDIX domain-containing protein [Gordonia mangrovi]
MSSSPPTEPAPLRDAATVVLVRDTAAGPEVFLQRRVKQMAFAGGVTVFPGGGVDPRDAEADVDWTGPGAGRWAEAFHTDEHTAQSLVCAAVRETFEECGVLLASRADGSFPDPDAFTAERAGLVDKSLSFAQFLRDAGLSLRADLLRPLAHWITPILEKRRYDTRFFLAALPPGQTADDKTTEAEVAGWATPQSALELWAADKHVLLPPTWAQLTHLREFDSVADILAAERRVEAIEPSVEPGAGLAGLTFAGSDRYFAVAAEREVPGLSR